jgi:hypothetical protein
MYFVHLFPWGIVRCFRLASHPGSPASHAFVTVLCGADMAIARSDYHVWCSVGHQQPFACVCLFNQLAHINGIVLVAGRLFGNVTRLYTGMYFPRIACKALAEAAAHILEGVAAEA